MPDVVDQVRRFFAADPRGVVAAWVFGSVARGTARPDSDVDVAVLYGAPPASTLAAQPYALEDDLTGALGRRAQVVSLHAAPPDLIHRVLRDGLLVHETDRAARVRFEVKARAEYFDVLPHLLRYRGAAP